MSLTVSLRSEPLLALLGNVSGPEAAARCGVTRRAITRWRAGGNVEIRTAESVCDRIGTHPCAVWGDDYLRACGVEE